MIFHHDRRLVTNTEHRFFDELRFQIGCLGKQTRDNLAKLFWVLLACMLAGPSKAANNGIFLFWLDVPHLVVDFAVTIEIVIYHYATQHAGNIAIFRSSIPFFSESGTASGVSMTVIQRKNDCEQPISSRV